MFWISMKGYCDHCKYARRLCGPNGSCEVRPKRTDCSQSHAANEGLVRIQYKCLVLIDVFPEMKLRGLRFIYSQNRSVYFAAAK
jgi:hypothetical protein